MATKKKFSQDLTELVGELAELSVRSQELAKEVVEKIQAEGGLDEDTLEEIDGMLNDIDNQRDQIEAEISDVETAASNIRDCCSSISGILDGLRDTLSEHE